MPRASPRELDALRARALRGDALRDLSESRREWVWRSLLKGVRIAEALALAGLAAEELEPALAAIRGRYRRRIDDFKREATRTPRGDSSAGHPAHDAQPEPTPAVPRPERRGLFHRRR